MKKNGVKEYYIQENAVLSGYITTLKNKQKLDVSSEGPSSTQHSIFTLVLPTLVQTV